jgi:hypothetical protein
MGRQSRVRKLGRDKLRIHLQSSLVVPVRKYLEKKPVGLCSNRVPYSIMFGVGQQIREDERFSSAMQGAR